MGTQPSKAEWLAARLADSRFGRRLDRMGPLSPLATLSTFAPGAQVLLVSAERDAERGLHIARGLLLVGVGLAGLSILGPDAAFAAFPPWQSVAIVVGLSLAWWWLWGILSRPILPSRLRYVLIVVDALLALQVGLLGRLVVSRWPDRLAPEDLLAVAASLVTYVAVSGAFRIDPRLAVFSTVCALICYATIAYEFGVPTRRALLVGATVWFGGFVSAHAARVFRFQALKAGEQAVLARYVPEALTRELVRTGDPTGEGTEAEVTVVIVDIRGYTHRSERLSPREAVAFLNDYFAVVVAQLAAEGAVLDKYIGDGVFSFFQGAGHAGRGLRAARRIIGAVERWNAEQPDREPLRVGVAVHTGRALVGTIGSAHKREYTVIADAVNVASRLEELNKHFGSAIVVSDEALRAAGDADAAGFVGPQPVELRGHEAPLIVHFLPAPG